MPAVRPTILAFAVALAFAFFSVPVATANHPAQCTPSASAPTQVVQGHHVFVDPERSVAVYRESNTIPGIQRYDDVRDQHCGHGADTLVFYVIGTGPVPSPGPIPHICLPPILFNICVT